MSVNTEFYFLPGIDPDIIIAAAAVLLGTGIPREGGTGLTNWGSVVDFDRGAAIGHMQVGIHGSEYGPIFCFYHAAQWIDERPFQMLSFPGLNAVKIALCANLAALYGGIFVPADGKRAEFFKPNLNARAMDADTDEGYTYYADILNGIIPITPESTKALYEQYGNR